MDCETFASKFVAKNRWRRIEQKHLSSFRSVHRHPRSHAFCKNVLNSAFVNERQMKRMASDSTWYLDPNLVMDLRHESIKRTKPRKMLRPQLANGYNKPSLDEFHQAEVIEREIEQFRCEIESQRRDVELFAEEVKSRSLLKESNVKFKLNDLTAESEELIAAKDCNPREGTPSDVSSLVNGILDGLSDTEAFESDDDSEPQMRVSIVSKPVPQREEDEAEHEEHSSFPGDPLIQLQIEDCVSVRGAENDREEVLFDETISPRKAFKGTFTLDHQLSIHIKHLSLHSSSDGQSRKVGGSYSGSTEGLEKSAIIEHLFEHRPDENATLLRKCFLKWVHYTTIERLTRNNVDQSRVKKMEIFLRNISLERKKALRKMKEISKSGAPPATIVAKMKKEHELNEQSPEMLSKKFNNKLKIQQDIIELQKMKLKRQERVIAELKLSRLLEDNDDSKNDIKDELKFVARNGCQKSRSKARCLQVAGNLKDEADDELYEQLQAKGLTAPKFLIEMQARALEREMKHQQARERREAIDRDREEIRMAAEEARRLEDQEQRRKRIEDLRRKRIEEKQRKIQKEMERLKFVADMEKAKYFHRYRMQKFVFAKLRNLIRIKKRNEKLATEFASCMRLTKCIVKWKTYVDFVWDGRKQRADFHHKLRCLRFGFMLWQKYYLAEVSKRLVAEDWCDLRITERWFRAWQLYSNQQRLINEMKRRKAEIHCEWHLKWKTIDHWRRLRIILKIEKETEQRREHWRKKVYELLPDYVPNRDDF